MQGPNVKGAEPP